MFLNLAFELGGPSLVDEGEKKFAKTIVGDQRGLGENWQLSYPLMKFFSADDVIFGPSNMEFLKKCKFSVTGAGGLLQNSAYAPSPLDTHTILQPPPRNF